jgi:hypothetical protein
MAASGGAAAGRILRSQATTKRREDDEDSGAEDETGARRDARRRKKRKDDGLEEDGAEHKEEPKPDEMKAPPAPKAEDALVDLIEPLFLLRNNLNTFINKLKPPAETASPLTSVQWGALVSQFPQVPIPFLTTLTVPVCQCSARGGCVCYWQELQVQFAAPGSQY